MHDVNYFEKKNSFHLNLRQSFLVYEIFVSTAGNVLPHAERLEAPEPTKRNRLPFYCSWSTITEAMENLSAHKVSCQRHRVFPFSKSIIHKMPLNCSFSFPFTLNRLDWKNCLQITIYFLSRIYKALIFWLGFNVRFLWKYKWKGENRKNYVFIKPQWNSSGTLIFTCK